jgi:sugar phosphate isomerase/epimerase
MVRPAFGVALNKLSASLEPDELRLIGQSKIEMLEVHARMLDNDPQGHKAVTLKQMGRGGGPRVNSLHAGDRDISILDEGLRRLAVDEMVQGIELAQQLGAGLIIVHSSGEPVNSQERSRRMEQAARSLQEMAPSARRRGVKLAVEMLPRTCLCNTISEIEQILAPLPRDVFGMCIDTNHFMANHRDLCDTIVHVRERLLEVHASDYDGVDELHALPGTGVVDWKGLMQVLRNIGFAGLLTYEVAFRDQPPLAERIRALEENFQWLSSL